MIRKSIRHFSSVDQEEIKRFSKQAHEWYNRNGPYALLHRMNPVRVGYIRHTLRQFKDNDIATPLKDLDIADIGCGGGFLSQPLKRLGANVVAVDASQESINIAKAHPGSKGIDFRCATAEDLVEESKKFDAVCALEIIEHVNNPQIFVETCSKLLKPDGFLFLSTINRNLFSYFLTIMMAEKVLNWVPNGTHDIDKYVKPAELQSFCINAGLTVLDISGMSYNPIFRRWHLAEGKGCKDMAMNYIMTARMPRPNNKV